MPAPSWRRAWTKTLWIKRLFGQIYEPSMANLGVEQWIASLRDTRASPLVWQENSSQKKTLDTSGQMSFAWYEKSNPPSASSKTSLDIYDWDSNKSTMTFDHWVTALRQACSRREKSVRLINGNDSSSWRTVKATEATGGCLTPRKLQERLDAGMPLSLRDQVKHLWPTARVCSANTPPQSEIAAGDPKKRLEVAAQCWPTPTAQDFHRRGPNSSQKGLAEKSLHWATPNTMDHLPPRSAEAMEKMLGPEGQRAGRSRPSNLREQIMWLTPRAQETEESQETFLKRNGDRTDRCFGSLTAQAKDWPTVTTQDAKNNAGPSQFERNTKPLNVEAVLHHSRQGRMATGEASQKVLNPQFVEWLMGWPIGWTGLEPVGMASYHWRQLMRGALSRLELENTE